MKIFWKNATSDNFSNPGDWSTGAVPGPADIAVITVPGFYTVTADSSPTVLGINTGAGATLAISPYTTFTANAGTALGANRGTIAINDQATLQIGGTFNNPGAIALDSAGDTINSTGTTTNLLLVRDTTLKGGGTVVMSDSTSNAIGTYGNTYPGPVLTNVDNTIAGAGIIGITYYSSGGYTYYYYGSGTLINEKNGIIDATGANNQLQIYSSVTNSGLIEATGAAGLWLDAYVNNTGGIIAASANSLVDLVGGSILGGTVQGSFFVPDGHSETLEGPITDNATITLQSTGDATTLIMGLYYKPSGTGTYTLVNPTLTGGGNIVLSGPNSQIIGQGYNPVTFTNAGVTISGGGTIGGGNLTLNNKAQGVIDATNSYYPLIIDTGANTVTNAGTLKAEYSGELLIASNLSNTGTLNANYGTILIAGTVTGTGSAIINGNGEVEFGAASSNGVKFAAGSTGELVLDDSKQYTGTVSGFGTNTTQSIDLSDINFATATKSYANGILTVKDGVGDIAHIKFSGTHTLASFNLQDDGQGGVLITDPPATSKAHSSVIALLGNYMATSLVTPFDGHGGTLFSEGAQTANQLMPLTTPHMG